MTYTINALLSMQKALNLRRQQLETLKNQCASRTVYRSNDGAENITEPTYDVKKLDALVTKINKALWDVDQKIKEANAKTTIEVSLDFDSLMTALE